MFKGAWIYKKIIINNNLWKSAQFLVLLFVFLFNTSYVNFWFIKNDNGTKELPYQAKAFAGQFVSTGGYLNVGSEANITSGAATGNTGSWKGALALETTSPGLNWTVNTATSGTARLDQQLYMDNVETNGANTLIITANIYSASSSLSRLYQICDWTSTSYVDNAADSQCTGGGWRTLNVRKAGITRTTMTSYIWHVYDGYWTESTTSNTPVSTPLSNFIETTNKRILIRAYSESAVSTTHSWNYLGVNVVIDSLYTPASFTQITGGAVSTSYINTTNSVWSSYQTASDNTYLSVPGTASAISDFYVSFKNIKTLTSMNTIILRAEHSCSSTDITYRPKIYNFNSSAWEDLTTTDIACSATDATNAFAKNNVTISNYISNGEVRIGWYGSGNSTTSLRLDMIYIMIGSTNTDDTKCEISFGTGTAADCSKTRDLDTTLASPNTWQQTTEAESATMSHDYYAYDNDTDATSSEHASSANLWLPITMTDGKVTVALLYAMNFRSNSATITNQGQFKDFSGANATISGGWTNFGTTNVKTTYTYEDVATNGYFTSNSGDYIDTANNRVNVRVRTSAGTSTSSTTRDIDFVFISTQWIEPTTTRSSMMTSYVPTRGYLNVGTETSITSRAATGNTGSWKGTLALETSSPGLNWTVNTVGSTNPSLDQQLYIDDVRPNLFNKLIITMSALGSNTGVNRYYQICDWTSTSYVDNAADSYCTGGGWRTMNIRKVAVTSTSMRTYVWHIYDGYWTESTTSNTPVSTPLSNFIKSDSKTILIRAFSNSSTTSSTHTINYLNVQPVYDSIYSPAGFTQITGGAVSTSYINTTNALWRYQSASDNAHLSVPGTASAISDFYLSFKNVETFTGANSILVRAEHECSTTGITYRPKIYNFNSSAWEDLTTTDIACTTTDATNAFVKNNVTIANYISNGEVRIGWYGSGNSTVAIVLDMIYIMIGSTNTDDTKCEISFGTGTASNCSNTRDLDTTLASPNTWQQTGEAESTAMSHAYYAYDNDTDATSNEYANSANLWFSLGAPSGSVRMVTGYSYAARFSSGATTNTMQGQFKDFSGVNATISGGWTAFGTTNALATYTYEDSVTNGYFSSNQRDYLDTVNSLINMRFRTTLSTATSTVDRNIDFAMVGLQWVEKTSPSLTITVNDETVTLGNFSPGIPNNVTTSVSVNMSNGISGYNLSVKRDDSDTTLDMTTDASKNIIDATAWDPTANSGSGNATTTPGQTLAFRVNQTNTTSNYNTSWWGNNDDVGTAKYAGLPSTSQKVVNCTTCNTGSTNTIIKYLVDAPTSQFTGAYDGSVTFTAIVNP